MAGENRHAGGDFASAEGSHQRFMAAQPESPAKGLRSEKFRNPQAYREIAEALGELILWRA
jgi:hypothetical protein